jgi:ATP-dependent DNA helicase RecG
MTQVSLFNEDEAEQDFIEYKTAANGKLPKDLWECVTAFSNAEGGNIILGVKPDGTSAGLNREDLDTLQRDIQSSFQNVYSFRIHPSITVRCDTVSIYVPPAPAAVRPVHVLRKGPSDGARVRVGSSNEKIDSEWLKRFTAAAQGGAEILWSDGSISSMLDKESVQEFIDKLNNTRGGVYDGFSYEEIIKKLRIVNEKGQISMFGLLAFSKDAVLQDVISPTVTVSVTKFSGTSKISEEDEKTFVNNREFFGPVKSQFNNAYSFILSNISLQGTIDTKSGIRTDEYQIPALAIREALANTIAHRDYSVHSSKIQVDIYSDRIEFINPGKSLVPISELEKTPSVTRNPLLMNYMRETGITEHLARGIRKIKNELRKAGLKEPSFQNISNTFIATIYGTAFINSDDKAWLKKFNKLRLNERQLACLIHLRKSGDGINNAEYRDLNGLNKMGDDKKTNKELRRLVLKGLIIKKGASKSTRYYLVNGLS